MEGDNNIAVNLSSLVEKVSIIYRRHSLINIGIKTIFYDHTKRWCWCLISLKCQRIISGAARDINLSRRKERFAVFVSFVGENACLIRASLLLLLDVAIKWLAGDIFVMNDKAFRGANKLCDDDERMVLFRGRN